jgi:AcrR family transcriptional regulator
MTPTKQRIVASAIRLFNEQGVAEVRLQQIADAAGMSTGNLAYHFSNKEAILEAAILQAHEALAEVLRLFSSHPNLLDFEVQLAQLFQVVVDFPFFFANIQAIERLCPGTQPQNRQFLARLAQQFERRIALNRQRGILGAADPLHYRQVAGAMTLTCFHWPLHQQLVGQAQPGEAEFKQAVWLHLLPYLTEAGKAEFDLLLGSPNPGLEKNF